MIVLQRIVGPKQRIAEFFSYGVPVVGTAVGRALSFRLVFPLPRRV